VGLERLWIFTPFEGYFSVPVGLEEKSWRNRPRDKKLVYSISVSWSCVD